MAEVLGIESVEATVQSQEETQTFRGTVTPHHPRTDEISAIADYAYREMKRLGLQAPPVIEIKFWGHPECPLEKIHEFLTEGFLPIEIGDLSYQTVGAGSATEALVRTLGYDPATLTTGEVKLMEILASRNSNGYMNTFYMSLPKILKDVYTLPGYDELDVITRYQDIVHAFLEYENKSEEVPEPEMVRMIHSYLDYMNLPEKQRREATEPPLPEELADLIRMTAKCNLAPFTPGRYLRDLCDRGESADQIREKVGFWIKAVDDCQREYNGAKSEWPRMEKLRFSFNGLSGAAIETANSFIPKVCFGKDAPERVELLVIRNPESGHTAILTRRRDTQVLYTELARHEPGCWHRHESTGNLLNGGLMYSEVSPTNLSFSGLARLVSQFPPR